ncbi:hypothetical protein C8R42DRAFT_711200 [Lentinula raphanica]|nr:hypothetical protein C8R42DRAFT_711200 [Lentinula raphanica]
MTVRSGTLDIAAANLKDDGRADLISRGNLQYYSFTSAYHRGFSSSPGRRSTVNAFGEFPEFDQSSIDLSETRLYGLVQRWIIPPHQSSETKSSRTVYIPSYHLGFHPLAQLSAKKLEQPERHKDYKECSLHSGLLNMTNIPPSGAIGATIGCKRTPGSPPKCLRPQRTRDNTPKCSAQIRTKHPPILAKSRIQVRTKHPPMARGRRDFSYKRDPDLTLEVWISVKAIVRRQAESGPLREGREGFGKKLAKTRGRTQVRTKQASLRPFLCMTSGCIITGPALRWSFLPERKISSKSPFLPEFDPGVARDPIFTLILVPDRENFEK